MIGAVARVGDGHDVLVAVPPGTDDPRGRAGGGVGVLVVAEPVQLAVVGADPVDHVAAGGEGRAERAPAGARDDGLDDHALRGVLVAVAAQLAGEEVALQDHAGARRGDLAEHQGTGLARVHEPPGGVGQPRAGLVHPHAQVVVDVDGVEVAERVDGDPVAPRLVDVGLPVGAEHLVAQAVRERRPAAGVGVAEAAQLTGVGDVVDHAVGARQRAASPRGADLRGRSPRVHALGDTGVVVLPQRPVGLHHHDAGRGRAGGADGVRGGRRDRGERRRDQACGGEQGELSGSHV